MFQLTGMKCSDRKGNLKYSVDGRVTCGRSHLPITLAISRNRHASDIRILLLCPARRERQTIRKLSLFANVRRATICSTRVKRPFHRPIAKIGILFPMDERKRTFRDYLSIAEHAIGGIDRALNRR